MFGLNAKPRWRISVLPGGVSCRHVPELFTSVLQSSLPIHKLLIVRNNSIRVLHKAISSTILLEKHDERGRKRPHPSHTPETTVSA